MSDDKISITILPDGTIRTETDQISPANHQSADQFLAFLAKLTGGETMRTKRKEAHHHQHQQEHQHG